jgi:uncharacterized membrane protein (DUF373 family)
MTPSRRPEHVTWIARAFTATEDFVYIGLGCLLAASAVTLLATSVIAFWQGLVGGRISTIELLDRILLILLIVELLYTVQVSLREHTLVPEPFLLVGLISAIRRVLVLTAEFDGMHEKVALAPQQFAVELAVLTVLILALAVALILLRRRTAAEATGPG